VSTFLDSDGNCEAFSFLRFVHATADELAVLPPRLGATGGASGDPPDFVRRPIGPLSLRNELAVLRHLARLCTEQLDRYPTALEEDRRELRSGRWPYGSNRRNALVLVAGEKVVCAFFIRLAETADALAAAPLHEARASLAAPAAPATGEASDADQYLRAVLLRLLQRHHAEQELLRGGSGRPSLSGEPAFSAAIRGAVLQPRVVPPSATDETGADFGLGLPSELNARIADLAGSPAPAGEAAGRR